VRAGHLIAVSSRWCIRGAKLPKLGIECLPIGADAGVADQAPLFCWAHFSWRRHLCDVIGQGVWSRRRAGRMAPTVSSRATLSDVVLLADLGLYLARIPALFYF
jgi:hypothetical protein